MTRTRLLHLNTAALKGPIMALPQDSRSDTKMSVEESSGNSELFPSPPPRTESYMASLVPPSQEHFERIAQVQEQKEEELRQRDRQRRIQAIQEQKEKDALEDDRSAVRTRAARLIQKTFRGHRARRELDGFGLDANTRWISALREAEFRRMTRPASSSAPSGTASPLPAMEEGNRHDSNAKLRWKKASIVARRAGHDNLESDTASTSSTGSDASDSEQEGLRLQSNKLLHGRRNYAQMMGLPYFLEMVDLKHRYGSNLRMYHAEWKKSETRENFFYWLDFGEGKNIELDACPRERLEREKVRYLSREERQYYLVRIDDEGRLRWAKNGARIDTTEQYKDSIHGVVPINDPTPAFNPELQPRPTSPLAGSCSSSLSSIDSKREADKAAKYVNHNPGESPPSGVKKVTHISASTIWNKMLRRSVKDGTWIFVADTSFRLYVGIKNSGGFQHSSFLQGSRISAAGLIKIKKGRIGSLSPLSGHYRPPASNFSAFVKSLREGGVDMSHVSISKSYAILVGLETYVKTRKKSKHLIDKVMHGKDKIVAPEVAHRREEEAKDTSQSAQREREVVEREENRAAAKMMEKLKVVPREPKGQPEQDKTGR